MDSMNDGAVPPMPWWKYGYVWLVIGGPAAVVLAGLATAWIALANPETMVVRDHGQAGAAGKALAPAVQGRNHAATPAR